LIATVGFPCAKMIAISSAALGDGGSLSELP